MTEDELTAIRKRVDEATPGPWMVTNRGTPDSWDVTVPGPDIDFISLYRGMFQRRADADFMAQARDDIPSLLAETEQLTNQRDAYRSMLNAEQDDRQKHEALLKAEIERLRQLVEGPAARKVYSEEYVNELSAIGSKYMKKYGELLQEAARLNSILNDPVAVELNMKRGLIAMPTTCHWETDTESKLRAENERLRTILRDLEWLPSEKMDPVLFPNLRYCPVCHMPNHYGHLPDCRLAKTLGA